jgi:hypothetical protein
LQQKQLDRGVKVALEGVDTAKLLQQALEASENGPEEPAGEAPISAEDQVARLKQLYREQQGELGGSGGGRGGTRPGGVGGTSGRQPMSAQEYDDIYE